MSDQTRIEWTDATWNPVTGCTKVSDGCKHCYAKHGQWPRLAANTATVYYKREFEDVQCHPQLLDKPLRWRKPRRIFVNSMSDLFHPDVPDDFILRVFDVMRRCTHSGGQNQGRIGVAGHTFQVLTKRPKRMREFMGRLYWDGAELVLTSAVPGQLTAMLEQIWIGVSVEDQATADERIPLLLDTPAAVRWVSYEPALAAIDWIGLLQQRCVAPSHPFPNLCRDPGHDIRGIDWLVAGGESGPHARPSHPDWFRAVRDQCRDAGVPFNFKQWGAWVSVSELAGPGEHYTFPDGATVRRIGKKCAGRLLDEVIWDQYPVVRVR
jgi:protein gp37